MNDRSRILDENSIVPFKRAVPRATSSRSLPLKTVEGTFPRASRVKAVSGPAKQAAQVGPAKQAAVGPVKQAAVGPTWPTSTGVWCWWCCHPFDGVPIPLPVGYNEGTDVFDVRGVFCCWGCVKAYNHEHNGYRYGIVENLITLLHKRLMGRIERIKSSPPRCALAVFGGPLTIDQFRNVPANQTYRVLSQNMIPRVPNMVQFDAQEYTPTPSYKQHDTPVDFKRVTSKSEPLRLKRTKPTVNHKNTLEKVMGISIAWTDVP